MSNETTLLAAGIGVGVWYFLAGPGSKRPQVSSSGTGPKGSGSGTVGSGTTTQGSTRRVSGVLGRLRPAISEIQPAGVQGGRASFYYKFVGTRVNPSTGEFFVKLRRSDNGQTVERPFDWTRSRTWQEAYARGLVQAAENELKKLGRDARCKLAEEANKRIKDATGTSPNISCDDSVEDAAGKIGATVGATGAAAACAALGAGAAVAPLCGTVGAYVGAYLGEKTYDLLEDAAKWAGDALGSVGEGIEDAANWVAGLF